MSGLVNSVMVTLLCVCENQFFCLPPVYHSGSLTLLLDIHPSAALVLAVIPPAIFLGISFKIKPDTQIVVASVLSILYAFLMMIAAVAIIGMLDTNSEVNKA